MMTEVSRPKPGCFKEMFPFESIGSNDQDGLTLCEANIVRPCPARELAGLSDFRGRVALSPVEHGL